MANAKPMENPVSDEQPQVWFRRWLAEGKKTPKEPQTVNIENNIDNLNIAESIKVKCKEEEEKPKTGKEASILTCSMEATSFIDGEINIENTGDNFVVCPKILIDTGALVPSGIAVSDDFFVEHLGGEHSKLRPSQLLSANGATTTGSMKTVGEASVQIRFTSSQQTTRI